MDQPLLLDNNDRHIDDIKQSFSLVQQFLRWILSVLCVVFLLASLVIYQNKGNLASNQVKTFNAISTILTLLLGLCFFVSLTC